MKTETNHPLRWVPSAYFAMGLPFVILNMVCVLMFKGLGIADSQIALWTSIIMFPWTSSSSGVRFWNFSRASA